MIIQAEMRRKQSEYEGEACVVDKVIELPAQRFKQFSRALLADYDFIAENKSVIQYDADSRHCLLILDVVGTDGFLVDPQGYNYARYSAFVPNVRSLLTPDVEIDRSYLSLAEPWRDESRDTLSVGWRVTSSQHWGVPQRRARIFLVADFGGLTAPKILFKPESLPGYTAPVEGSWKTAAEKIGSCFAGAGGTE